MADERFAKEFDAIAALLGRSARVLVVGHVDPDGDCVGSMLALAEHLVGRGAAVACFTPGEMADVYRALPLARLFVPESAAREFGADLVIALDSPTTARTADIVRGNGVPVVNIDHHPTNERFGDVNVVDESVCATAILVYRFLARVAPRSLTPETARYLYIGVLMDTGGFRFRNTDAEALAAAARFAELGARPYELAHDFLYAKKLSTLRILARALDSLEVHAGGRIAVMSVSRDMLDAAGGVMSDTEGFVDYAASIDDVELAALLREIGPGETRVSLRSRDSFNVASLAESFGGGGHRNAAGLTLREGLAAARSRITASLEVLLAAGPDAGAGA